MDFSNQLADAVRHFWVLRTQQTASQGSATGKRDTGNRSAVTGHFAPSALPWLGWLMLLEDCPNSTSPVKVNEPHFKVFDEFTGASYARRYEIFCERLVRERLYNSACLILLDAKSGQQGKYTEPNPEFAFKRFATSLKAHAMAFAQMRQ